MGGLLVALLLWSCLLSAVDGTFTFCSQHGSSRKVEARKLIRTLVNTVRACRAFVHFTALKCYHIWSV